jgi:hypothetical protein
MKLAIAAAAVLALAMTASPVTAAQTIGERYALAEAGWYFTQGGDAYGVSIQALIDRSQGPGAPNQRMSGVSVSVTRAYFDPTTGEPVEATIYSDPFWAPVSSLTIKPTSAASLKATVTLAEPVAAAAGGGGGGGGSGWGPFTVQVNANWTVTSAATRKFSDIWDTEFGTKTMDRRMSTTRDANVTGSLSGSGLELGDMGGVTGGSLMTAKLFQMLPSSTSRAAVSSMLMLSQALNRSTVWAVGGFAEWYAHDSRDSRIDFTLERDLMAKGAKASLFASGEIIQDFCDTTTNELIEIDVSSDATPATSGWVDRSMKGMAGQATLTLNGYISRVPDCNDPRWDEQTFEAFGPVQATMSGTWTPTGGIDIYRVAVRERGPAGNTSGMELNRGRQASAIGAVTSDLVTGALTDVGNAFVYDDRTRRSG